MSYFPTNSPDFWRSLLKAVRDFKTSLYDSMVCLHCLRDLAFLPVAYCWRSNCDPAGIVAGIVF
ncbi:hypothetical protein [Oxynema aestuarii]|uniref:Uncharacterized protein n=1 Tax=Oxynema aestuarii AP17 TaxID=2064643 RepID=A0A6H1U3H8_9CYAN|nr:hypothetical protein [Oxynema aestuarii]QIZ72986.1 hypothetical protein HCG48_22245 [Oxynema aestuarii AP17]